ncbi:hypothetical protein JCM15519_29300 [Fundidesulfovibrio butyratiphilus]
MNKKTAVFVLFVLFLVSACAKKYHSDNGDMTPNLEPEITADTLKINRPRPLTEQEKKALASKIDIPFNLDVRQTEEVQMFLTYFTQERRDTMRRWLERAQPHLPYIRAVLSTYKLPPDLIALPFIESGYNTMAYSPVGAGGMWQFMPATGRRFGLNLDWWEDERRNPYLATIAAAKYLSELYNMFGDWNLALAAYNCGEGKMSRVMAQSGQSDFFDIAKNPNLLKQETRHYVPKFLAVLYIFKNLESLGFNSVQWNDGRVIEEVNVPGGTDLAAMADACSMSWEEFHGLNPSFRRQVSPPDRQTHAYLPQANKERALAYLSNPACFPNKGLRAFAAVPGDTWWTFSRRTGVPVAALRQMNPNLGETILADQTVVIPMDSSAQDTALASMGEERPVAKPQPEVRRNVAYKLKRGETLASVSKQFGVSRADILKANNAKYESQIGGAGRTITVPVTVRGAAACQLVLAPTHSQPAPASAAQTRTVEVRKGDTLSSLAQTHKISVKDLMAANKLKSGKDLRAGMRLTLPGQAQPAAPVQVASRDRDRDDNKKTDARTSSKSDKRDKREKSPDPKTAAKADSKSRSSKVEDKKPSGPQKPIQYHVASGETVWSIARKLKVDPHAILAWNNLNKSVTLRPGDKLKIFQ